MSSGISEQGIRILEALGHRRSFQRSDDGWRSRGLIAANSLIAELERRNLVVITPGGRLRLTSAGEAWCQRRKLSGPRNRMLVERAVPGDSDDAGSGPAAVPAGTKRVRNVTVNLAESPLGWLMARGMISERQFAAGERLRADWTLAGMGPRVTMRWDPAPAHSQRRGPTERLDPTLVQIAARRRFDEAIDQAGRGLSDILWRVVCAGEGLTMAESALGWPKRAGKLVLGLALDRIADYYAIR